MSKPTSAKKTISLLSILLLLLTGSIFFVPVFVPVLIPAAQAQNSRNRSSLIEKIKRFFFGSRTGGVAKGRKRGGAVRGPCRKIGKQLIALVPSNQEDIPFVEKTTNQRPDFWFYVPPLPVDEANAEFLLMDESENVIYSETFPISTKAGIVRLKMSNKNIPALEANKNYRWAFSAVCRPQDRAADVIVDGWLKQVPASSSLSQKLKVTPVKKRVSVYADNELWYETLTNLAELREQNPQDAQIQADWASLLQLMGLPPNAPQTWKTYSLPSPSGTDSSSSNRISTGLTHGQRK